MNATEATEKKSLNFIEQAVENDLREGKNGGKVQTRFPPEPNGYLHIGHAKAICLDFGIAARYGGVCNLRFDDTNPTKEDMEYVEAIKEDIQWLGFQWGNEYYASDYFQQLWDFAVNLIKEGKAYIDEQNSEQIAAQKGTPTQPGTESPYRNRPIEESLELFNKMNSGEIEEGKTMGSVLPVLFLLIAVLTMVTTMHRIAAKEKLQIGTLKALGFKDRRILRHYTSYAFMVGIAGSAAGVALGYFVAYMIMNPDGAMGTYFDMPEWKLYLPWFCYVIPAGIILLLTLIGYLSVKKMLQGTAADALRPYSPKKMRRLLIEKSHIFDRLSFGARWNLRDAMRHKSRMAMSLIGIVGCTLIIAATLGMRDTMDDFLKTYYDDATNYSSRIYIAEDATPDERDKLADKYDGDWSSSVSVQIEDKAVSLDIYDTSKDRVRFPADRDGFAELSDDGAYICRRIADEFDLEQGDSIKISPYGSNDEYTLKVAGIIRSVSENIVISPEYAGRIGIDYVIDSVYTDTPKADIKTDGAIKSVQSKQAIIDSFDSFMEIMNLMIVIFILAAAVLGVVVLYNLGVMSYTERYTEMATLKVTGFRDRKIGRLLAGQNLWISVIGIIIGIPAGAGALSYLMTALAPEYELKIVIGPVTYIVSVLLTFGVSMAVSLMVARKNRHIDMVEALKGTE